MLLRNFLNHLEMVPIAPIITCYHLFIHSTWAVFQLWSLYLKTFSRSFFIIFLPASLPIRPPFHASSHIICCCCWRRRGGGRGRRLLLLSFLSCNWYVIMRLHQLPGTPFSDGSERTLHNPSSRAICWVRCFAVGKPSCWTYYSVPLLKLPLSQHYSSTLRIATRLAFSLTGNYLRIS